MYFKRQKILENAAKLTILLGEFLARRFEASRALRTFAGPRWENQKCFELVSITYTDSIYDILYNCYVGSQITNDIFVFL